jgi:uncharacterized OsmC-like protein/TusA-related sulfurtransferase
VAGVAPELPTPDAVCDGGDLDCGSGLLLIIRNAMAPLAAGGLLEVRSREHSVREDLPAWCRMVGHTLLGTRDGDGSYVHYLIRKKGADVALQTDLEQARAYTWQTRVRWTDGMRGKAFARNHSFEVGQVASFDTEDAAPSAIEYLLGAVGGALVVGFQWRLSQRGITVRNLEISLKARSANILVFLGVEHDGDPALESIDGRVYVDADAAPEVLAAVFQETLRRCPVTRSLLRAVPVNVELKQV